MVDVRIFLSDHRRESRKNTPSIDHLEADIRLEVINRRGVFATLASVIAEEDSNINHVLVTARDDRNSAIRFTIEVSDRKHLARIIRRLRARRSVIRVSRSRG